MCVRDFVGVCVYGYVSACVCLGTYVHGVSNTSNIWIKGDTGCDILVANAGPDPHRSPAPNPNPRGVHRWEGEDVCVCGGNVCV